MEGWEDGIMNDRWCMDTCFRKTFVMQSVCDGFYYGGSLIKDNLINFCEANSKR